MHLTSIPMHLKCYLHLSSPDNNKKKKGKRIITSSKAINAKLETFNETEPLKMKQQSIGNEDHESPHRHSN